MSNTFGDVVRSHARAISAAVTPRRVAALMTGGAVSTGFCGLNREPRGKNGRGRLTETYCHSCIHPG
jgi:hypothetical protein